MHSFATVLLALAALPLYAFAAHVVNNRRHADIALNPRQGSNAKFTYYDITTGTTACGHNHGANDYVVALNAAQFSNSQCGKAITITCNGKTTSAIIDDECPGCPPGGLDMTQGLFEYFAPVGAGVISGDWSFAGAAPAPVQPTSSPPPPSPTSQYIPPSTSQQSTPSSSPPSSSSSSTSTSAASTTSGSVSSAASATGHQSSSMSNPTQTSSGVNYPAGTITPGQNQSINSVYDAMIGLGYLAVALSPK